MAHILASFITISRMTENHHYLHDVVFGATIGLSYGWGIYMNHKKYRKPYWISFAPSNDFKGGQLFVSYKF